MNSGPHAFLASALTHWAIILLALITGTFDEVTMKGDLSGPSGFWAKEQQQPQKSMPGFDMSALYLIERSKWERNSGKENET